MSDTVVTIKQGNLRGATSKSLRGGSYLSFRGIPYATPPVGDLRFRDPQPPQPWTGVRDAVKEGPKCAQFDPSINKIIGEDDCLYLNVATTSLAGSRPVMVWIHGGAFIVGDGGFDTYIPDYLVASGIVYVGINYRLGVLGFLNLDHKVAPGNMGLKDQIAALEWVKDNIAQFGGDPNNVTIFGESAGSASVHYLLLSPLAKGLFHKAILQSGVMLNHTWAHKSGAVSVARRLVAALGKDITDPEEIVEYLRTIPCHRLIEIQALFAAPEGKPAISLPFGPTVDESFMLRPPEEVGAEGSDVPVIIGYNSHEGIFGCIKEFWPLERPDEAQENFDETFAATVPPDLVVKSPSKVPEIIKTIRKFYFGDKRVTSDRLEEYVQYYGDLNFGLGIHRTIEILRNNKSPTYFYRFCYDSTNVATKKFSPLPVKGTTHGAELQYLLLTSPYCEHINIEPGSTEAAVQDRFVRMWTDFAKTGNPTPSTDDLITEKWEPVTRTTKNYLEINAELASSVNPDAAMWDTWQSIYAMTVDQ